MAYLYAAGRAGADLTALPEQFRGAPGQAKAGGTSWPAEPLDGPTITAVAAVARRFKMYVVAPIRELEPATGRQYNTAVLLGRQGEVVGRYRKMSPVLGAPPPPPPLGPGSEVGVTPGLDGMPVFNTDIGRLAIITCFDVNFVELWASAAAQQADIVVWPSAMVLPDMTSHALARIHHFAVVGVRQTPASAATPPHHP